MIDTAASERVRSIPAYLRNCRVNMSPDPYGSEFQELGARELTSAAGPVSHVGCSTDPNIDLVVA